MSGRDRLELGYLFAPIPLRLFQALRNGRLSGDDYQLVSLLFERADRKKLAARRETPRLTLGHLAEGIGWRGRDEALSKRLRRLRGS